MPPTTSVFVPVSTELAQMISQIQSSGSAITDFIEGSGARTLLEAFAVVVSNNTATADQLQLDSHLDTATADALDALASNWLVTRNPAIQATGTITITRQNASGAMLLPAGWTQLATTPSIPGTAGVAVVTTQDASFADGTSAVTVTAQAVLGGAAGNLAALTYLTPLSPVNGISSQKGYQVATAFTNGVDAETDPAFRARIPLAVQGRILGKRTSFLAAALGVPGVLSANVLTPGNTRGDGSLVPAGNVEIYYQGSTGLLSAVQSAAQGAATVNQNPLAYASASLTAPRGPQRLVAAVTVYYHPGTDPVALATNVSSALQNYVNTIGVGNKVYLALAINAVLSVTGVASVSLPLTQFSLFGASGSQDIPIALDSYASLAAADVIVVATALAA